MTVDEVSRFNDELAKYSSLGGQSLTTAARAVLAPEPREEWDRHGGSRQLTSDDQDAVRKLESAIAIMALSEKAKLSNDLVAKRLNTFVYGPIPPKLDPEKRRNFFNSDASMRNFRNKTRTLKTAERNALNEWTTLVIGGSLRYKKSEIHPFETAAGGSAVNASQGTNQPDRGGSPRRNVVDNGAAAVASGNPPAMDSATSAAAPPPASDAACHMREEASASATAGAAARSGGGGDDGSDSDDHALLTTDYKSHMGILAQTSASQPRGRRRERSGDPSSSPKPSPKRATNEDRPRANVPSLGLGATVIIRAGPHHGRRGVIVDEIWGNEARIKIDGDLVEYATARLSWLAAVAEGGGEANAAAATTSDMDEDET